jgi:hypothetical protein
MNSAEGHPQTNVSFSATAPFVRAFGETIANEQHARYNTPTSQTMRNPLLPDIPAIVTPYTGSTATLPHNDDDNDDAYNQQHAFAMGMLAGVSIALIIIGIAWMSQK